jgi:hypothetical protein
VAADVAVTGQVSTDFEGETTTINFGTSTLNASFEAFPTQVQAMLSGNITIDTLCTDGAFDLTISTIEALVYPDEGDGTPSSGTILVNDVPVDFSTNPSAIPCSGFL